MKKVLSIIGTRPEVIKMAPVIHAFNQDKSITSVVVSTAQHREILDQMMKLFEIKPDLDLNIMEENQTLPSLTAKLITSLNTLLEVQNPDIVLAQGDTTTAFVASLACFYRKIPFAHVEAGLRTKNNFDPFPEEINRVLISHLSAINFAPTQWAADNLLKEGVNKDSVHITGNTCIDSLKDILKKEIALDPRIDLKKKIILVTTHRRENWGEKLNNICESIKTIADNNVDVQIVLPVHPNPNVKSVIESRLSNHPRILLQEPLSYETFVTLMKRAYLILSDSGGVQEEAPSLRTPVLVLRETTERPEACQAGAAKLVGTSSKEIIKATQELLDDIKKRQAMIIDKSPYGDGTAAQKILTVIKSYSR
jgi:UDP-N-acetylglucosamine 2-epimerase (non-hydrolysing)